MKKREEKAFLKEQSPQESPEQEKHQKRPYKDH